MIQSKDIRLYLAPEQAFVRGRIVSLTQDMAEKRIHREWWNDPSLREVLSPVPIDRHWHWNEMEIEIGNRLVASEKVAVVAGDRGQVQGAMMISTEPVPSLLDPGAGGLFIELLFTAPWNRPHLRKDGQEYLKGVGLQLLIWAAWLSSRNGHEGRLLLDGSPDFVTWYERRGLQRLPVNPNVFEGIAYRPMELPPASAQKLLALWKE
jgi:hypothetical protein